MAANTTEQQVVLRTNNVQGLQTMLQTIRTKDKQDCVVCVAPEGLSVRMEDDSKCLQAQVFLKPQLFNEYDSGAGGRRSTFGLPLALLLDTVALFAPLALAEMTMRYPGPGQELVLEMQEGPLCTYAALGSVETHVPGELSDYWQDPSSHFLLQGTLLREAVEDLEWPGGPVVVSLTRDPRAVVLRSHGTGSLEVWVSIPTEALSSFHAAEAEVSHSYRYKHLATAMANIPTNKDPANVSTKVTLDSNGLMKVQHMINFSGLHPHHHHDAGGFNGPGSSSMQPSMGTQGAAVGNTNRVAVVTFYVLPQEEEEL